MKTLPVCMNCVLKREMVVEYQGVTAVYMFLDPPQPYQAWLGDLLVCPNCGTSVISRWGDKPIWEHYDGTPPPDINAAMVFTVYERDF